MAFDVYGGGSGGSLHANNLGVTITAPMSMACWAQKVFTTGADACMSVNRGNSNAQYYAVELTNDSANFKCSANVTSSTVEKATTSNSFTSLNEWHHFGATFGATGGGTLYAYLDGDTANRGSLSATKAPTLIDSYAVGSYNGTQSVENLYLAHLCWWDGIELTSGEMEGLADGIYPYQIRPDKITNYITGWVVDGTNDSASVFGRCDAFLSTAATFTSTEPPMKKRLYKKIFLPAAAAPSFQAAWAFGSNVIIGGARV